MFSVAGHITTYKIDTPIQMASLRSGPMCPGARLDVSQLFAIRRQALTQQQKALSRRP